MPLSPGGDPDVSIYYECSTFGRDRASGGECDVSHRVLWIAGVGCAQDVWENEIEFMRKHSKLKGGLSVCTFDNRGIGRSSSPLDKRQYSIEKVRLPTSHPLPHRFSPSLLARRLTLSLSHTHIHTHTNV